MLLRQFSGFLLVLGLLLTVTNEVLLYAPAWLASSAVWLAGLILFFELSWKQQRTVILISTLAFISWLVAWNTGQQSHFLDAFSVNQSMIVMLIGVQFLQLVALPEVGKQEVLPKGRRAFFKTYLGVHFFGSVINLSALLLVADRLARQAAISKNQQKLLVRAFTSGASWSPFFAAFAASFVYTPDASLLVVIPAGSLLAVVAFVITWREVRKDTEDKLDSFIGYPVHFEALWLPAVLVLLVFITQYYLPSLKVIILIAIYAVVISVITLLLRKGLTQSCTRLKAHIVTKLPLMKSELTLFLMAGVLGGGIAAAMDGLAIGIPIDQFNGLTASGLMFVILLLAFAGIHPIISIAVVGHWMISFEANQTLLAEMFLMSWAIGVVASPVSGVNLAMQGRYSLSARSIFSWNWRYAIKMYLMASVILMMTSYLLGI